MGEEGVQEKVKEGNKMHQQNRNMQSEKEENWSMIEFMQQLYGIKLVKVFDKEKV